ncbi:MAG TPA: hypothetical protein VFV52_02235 [Bacilli bacterium]|nr:hypothetical protein [Bacilli bacterium]
MSTQNVAQKIGQISELSKQLQQCPNEILKLPTSEFIRAFIEMTTAMEQIDALREVMRGRAEELLSRPYETEKKLRRERLKLVPGRKTP